MYHFNEICHRSRNRWDLKLTESNEFEQLCGQAVRTCLVFLLALAEADTVFG